MKIIKNSIDFVCLLHIVFFFVFSGNKMQWNEELDRERMMARTHIYEHTENGFLQAIKTISCVLHFVSTSEYSLEKTHLAKPVEL